MIPTLALTAFIEKWRDALVADAAIYAFCAENYGRPHKVYVGVPRKNPPTKADCPYIIIRPGSKVEGIAQEENNYLASVGWAILAEVDSETTTETLPVPGNEDPAETYDVSVIETPGIYEADELGQLILTAIDSVSGNNPISTANYELEVIEFLPQVVGDVQIEIAIDPMALMY